MPGQLLACSWHIIVIVEGINEGITLLKMKKLSVSVIHSPSPEHISYISSLLPLFLHCMLSWIIMISILVKTLSTPHTWSQMLSSFSRSFLISSIRGLPSLNLNAGFYFMTLIYIQLCYINIFIFKNYIFIKIRVYKNKYYLCIY